MRAQSSGNWGSSQIRAAAAVAAAAPPARSRRLPGAVCASGARLPPPHPGLLSARPQPAGVHRPPARRTQRTPRGDARPFLRRLAFPWAPTFRYHSDSPNLAFFIKRRISWESKWEQTVKCRLDVRSPIILSSLIPSLLTCAPRPLPHLCSHQSAPHYASHMYPMHTQGTVPFPALFLSPAHASSVCKSSITCFICLLLCSAPSASFSPHCHPQPSRIDSCLSIIQPTLPPSHPSVKSVFPTALLSVIVTGKRPLDWESL